MSKTIKVLSEHMNEHKDAVVILGRWAIKSLSLPNMRDHQEIFSRKQLRRKPQEFWKFYSEHVYNSELNSVVTHDIVKKLVDDKLVSGVIDLNIDGLLDFGQNNNKIIRLHGKRNHLICQSPECRARRLYDPKEEVPVCEHCGKAMRPDLLLFEDNYDQDKFDAVKHLVETTHTLIVIGHDYNEDAVNDLIGAYGDLRSVSQQPRVLVGVCDPSLEADINELARFDFMVKEDCDPAMLRLYKLLKG